jgi:hypothetical protein
MLERRIEKNDLKTMSDSVLASSEGAVVGQGLPCHVARSVFGKAKAPKAAGKALPCLKYARHAPRDDVASRGA